MKKLVFVTMLSAGLLAFGDDVAALEAGLKSDIMTIVNQVNPIDSATGQRKYISFAFITDFHKCRRVEGDDAAADPVKTYWYGSAGCLTESEQSIRLLGSLATDAGLDAVIAGGDFATAPIIGDGTKVGLTEEEYTNEIWNVKAMFDQHVPATVPLFAIDGNHERSYSLNGADMHMSDAAWAYVLTNFNTSASVAQAHNVDVTYHRDLAAAKLGDNQSGAYTGNSYHIDLRRLVASGGSNVRIACVSMYDSATGANPAYRVYDAAQFYDASGNLYDADLTPENTVMGMVAHGTEEKLGGTMARAAAGTLMNGFMNSYANPANKVGPWNLGTHEGKAFLGLVAGHLHFTNTKEITDPYDEKVNGGNTIRASAVSVASAYGVNYPAKPNQHELGTQAAYHFSIFVVDTDSNKFREIRLGGWSTNPVTHESPVVQLHDFNLRTKSGAAVDPGTGGGDEPGTGGDDPGSGGGDDPGSGGGDDPGTGGGEPGTVDPPEPGDGLLPGATAEETRQSIQAAIDAAVPTHGTVTLGNGLFEIDAQLMVTGGVTLVGQGWTNTIIKYAGVVNTASSRVATLSEGSTISGVTITGGKVKNNNSGAGGVNITDGGVISWCCITNNYAQNNTGGGIGVSGAGAVRIDHTVVANNSAGTAFAGVGGGIGIRGVGALNVEIDTCLVYGNTAGPGWNDGNSNGGGIGIIVRNSSTDKVSTIIRNTTIANNSVVGTTSLGGGIYVAQADTTLINCIVSGNAAEATATAGDANVAYKDAAIASAVGTKTVTCLFGGTPLFVDTANGDYHLAATSPAIEAGTDYAGLEKDLDGKYFSYQKPAIGCYEYGEYGPRPADEWDIPGTNGGIKGLDDGQGGKFIAFTSIAREGGTVAVGFRAAEIGASVGASFGLVCKDNLEDTETFTLNATLTDIKGALGELQTTTSKSQLFIVGIGAAANN